MFRPNKSQAPTSHRLPKMQKILSETDLQFVLSEAGNKRGVTIEMPFLTGQQSYMLTVLCTAESHEPVWTYYRGDDAHAEMLWRHPTGDVNLVLNLCASETGTGDAGYRAATVNTLMPTTQKLQEPSLGNTYSNLMSVNIREQVNQAASNVTSANQSAPNSSSKTATLEGDLSNMQIPTLLQSINMSKMTGKLVIEDKGQQAAIYFLDGSPTHAVTDETNGDPAIVEMITWEEGQFHFYPNEQTTEKSVKRRVDSLLMEGVTLLDQNKFVRDQGVRSQSYLMRKNDRLTEEEFKAALMNGAPLDFESQKRFYSAIDNVSTLMDVLRRVPMIKNEWVPIMFNMLSCGLVGVTDTPPQGLAVAPLLSIPKFDIDRSAIQAVARSLVRQETNVLTYPAFLYFLELEFTKCAAMGMPLSLMVFDLGLRVGNATQPMPSNFAREVLRRMEAAKRPFDVLGHFETFQYALFLPNTPSKGAKVFAARLIEMLGQDSGVPRPAGQIALTMGISSAPEDTMELALMLSAAREAKRRGNESGGSVTLFREVNQR